MSEEKTIEFLVSDLSEVKLVLRPCLPFVAEGFRLRDHEIEIFGEDKRIRLDIPEEHVDEITSCEALLLLEFEKRGSVEARETDLFKDTAAL